MVEVVNSTLSLSTTPIMFSTTSLAQMISTVNASAPMTSVTSSEQEHSKLTIVLLGTLYTLIFIIGIVGNGAVVYVVCVKKSMQSVTNLFIMNLALSDILMCLLAVPFTPISFFQDHWILGKFLCHLVPFSLGVSVYVSTLTSLAIAIDRYFVIVHPFKPRMKLGVCCLLIAVVWIVSISISLPLAIYIELLREKVGANQEPRETCRESWPIPMSKRFFNLASLVLQYLLPFVVITYSYTKVWIILSKRTRPGKTKEKEQIELKRKKRTNRMLVAMVIIFAGCWMPLNCVHLIMEFNTDFTKKTYFSTVFFIAHVIAMSSTIYNPFLYAWLNDNFRKEFRLILPWIFRLLKWCSNLGSSSSSTTASNNPQTPTVANYNGNEEDPIEQTRLSQYQINSMGAASNNNNNNIYSDPGKKINESNKHKSKIAAKNTSNQTKVLNSKSYNILNKSKVLYEQKQHQSNDQNDKLLSNNNNIDVIVNDNAIKNTKNYDLIEKEHEKSIELAVLNPTSKNHNDTE